MVVGATGLCQTILESCCQAKQPWQCVFLISWPGPDFWVTRVGTLTGGQFFEKLAILYKMYPT